MIKHITVEMWTEVGAFERVANPGDTVEDVIADHFLNCVPPLVMKDGYFQCSEPYDHIKVGTGKLYAPIYATFAKNRDGVWVFLGFCLRNETIHRMV